MDDRAPAQAPAAAARPMLWSGLESLSLALVSFVMLAMLARYLDADTFGRAALALGGVQIASSFVESFFHDAVVQRKDLQPHEVDAAHTAGMLAALALCGGFALYAALAPAPVGAGVGVAELLLWMSPSVLLSAASAMSVAQLRRHLAMRPLAMAMAGSRLLAGLAAIAALSQGAGVWALVLNQNLAALALLLLLLLARAPRARLTRDLSGLAPLAGYAAWNSGSSLLNANLSRFFQVACGFLLPAAVVGQLSLALRVVDMLVSVLVTGVSRVALSRLAAAAHGGGAVAAVFISTTRRLSFVMVPVLVLMAVLADPLVLFIGHGGWAQAASLVMWFAVAQALRSPTALVGTLSLALGRPRMNLVLSLTELVGLALALWVLQGPVAWAARLVLVMPVFLLLLQRPFGIRLLPLARAEAAPFVTAALMGIVLYGGLPWLTALGLSPWLTLLLGGSAGVLIYALSAALWMGLVRLARRPPLSDLALPNADLP